MFGGNCLSLRLTVLDIILNVLRFLNEINFVIVDPSVGSHYVYGLFQVVGLCLKTEHYLESISLCSPQRIFLDQCFFRIDFCVDLFALSRVNPFFFVSYQIQIILTLHSIKCSRFLSFSYILKIYLVSHKQILLINFLRFCKRK